MRFFCASVFAFLLLASPLAVRANDHGGGASGPAPMAFTLNLSDTESSSGRYLQFEMLLEGASPAVDATLASVRPKVQNEIIMLLSGSTADKLRTLVGKQDLAKRIKTAINKLINEDGKTGVKEVLFTNFVIQ